MKREDIEIYLLAFFCCMVLLAMNCLLTYGIFDLFGLSNFLEKIYLFLSPKQESLSEWRESMESILLIYKLIMLGFLFYIEDIYVSYKRENK